MSQNGNGAHSDGGAATGAVSGSFKDLHALVHTSTVDVFATGSRVINPDMEPRPGLFVIKYLPSKLTDPVIARRFEVLSDTITKAGGNQDLVTLESYTDTLADFLLRVLYSWNRTDPLTRAVLIDEVGPQLMSETLVAIQADAREKKASSSDTPISSLTTQQTTGPGKRRRN